MNRLWIVVRDRIAWFSGFAVLALVAAAVALVLSAPFAWVFLLGTCAVTCALLGLRE
jgi:hypothetical protein